MNNNFCQISKAIVLLLLSSINSYAQEEKKALTLSAYTEVYYLYNFNKPINNTQPAFLYNFNRNNEVNLNIGFVKASYNTEK